MARPPSNDIAHEQITDHWIRKRVTQERLPLATSGELVTVGGVSASDRDLGLAYAQMAARGDRAAGERALELLRHAEKENNGANRDAMLHTQLGFLEQASGNAAEAAKEYRSALQADPFESLAEGDLALIEAQKKDYGEAMRLWREVFEHDPTQLQAGINLAIVECGEGNRDGALKTMERLLEFAPDDDRVRALAAKMRAGNSSCAAR